MLQLPVCLCIFQIKLEGGRLVYQDLAGNVLCSKGDGEN